MTDETLEMKLAQLAKKHQKARDLLERELEEARSQAESARAAQEEAKAKLEELEAKRPRLAASIFSGKVGAEELEALDKEAKELRQRLEIAALAEEQSAGQEQEIAKRL